VRIFNLQDRNLADRSCGSPEKDLLIKILSGDKSDNIPACARGLGPKTAATVADMTEEARTEWLRKKGGENAIEQYNKNRTIIDFRCIPAELAQKMILT